MQVDLTGEKQPPIFLSPNYMTRFADQEGDLILSASSSLRHRLYDMDPAAYWEGEVASDASDDTIEFGLWLPGSQLSQDVDFIALLGHNAATFDVELSNDNGATYPGANKQTFTGQTETYSLRSLASTIAADRIKITLHTTQSADELKRVGAVIVGQALLQAPVGMSQFKRAPQRVTDRTARMHDGSTRRNYIYRSDASKGFHDFSVGFTGLSQAEADAMEAILMGEDPFIFIPEPGQRPDLIYFGDVAPGTFTRDYMTLSRSGGETITFDFEESGGS
jgi:hypothetical protein